MTIPPIRVVFMGTPDFAVPALKALAAQPDLAKIVAVYTQPDRPAGRGQKIAPPPVKVVAQELGLRVYQPENINDLDQKRELADHMSDAIVIVAYSQFLSRSILNLPRLGCVNVHSSLLPKFRGAAPIQYAIWTGETTSGVSTMRLVEKMDAGPVLLQRSIPIGPEMTAGQLHDELAKIGGEIIVETLEKLRTSQLTEVPQDETKVTYAPLISKEQGLIRWNSLGVEIVNKIRAFDPWPGTFGRSTRGILKILKAAFHPEVPGAPNTLEPGSVFSRVGGLWVRCQDGWIELLTVQPEGRKSMSVQEFMNGMQNEELIFEKEKEKDKGKV